MASKKTHSDFKERRNLHNFQRENTYLQRIGLQQLHSKNAELVSNLAPVKLTEEAIDFILKHEKPVECEIYILQLLDERAWIPKMALPLEVSKKTKNVLNSCSDEDLKLLKKRILDLDLDQGYDYEDEEGDESEENG